MPLQVLHQVYAACAATAWGLMKFSVPANAIAKWTCSANNRHTKGAKRGREEGEGRDARLKGANVNMNACPAASNISSAIGIQSKLLINMCAAWPRPRPAPAPAPDHGQANAKMTACCCCCCCNSVGVHGSGWRGACLASTVKEQWARGIAWPLDCRQMQCIHGKKFPPPSPLSSVSSSAQSDIWESLEFAYQRRRHRVRELPVCQLRLRSTGFDGLFEHFALLSLRCLIPNSHRAMANVQQLAFPATQSGNKHLCVCMNAFNSESRWARALKFDDSMYYQWS